MNKKLGLLTIFILVGSCSVACEGADDDRDGSSENSPGSCEESPINDDKA